MEEGFSECRIKTLDEQIFMLLLSALSCVHDTASEPERELQQSLVHELYCQVTDINIEFV